MYKNISKKPQASIGGGFFCNNSNQHHNKLLIAYRFGFNGQLKDNEVYGEGNAYSFDFRIHDPRVGRFLSIDPLFREYPFSSPYVFAENDVIRSIDVEGREKEIKIHWVTQSDKPVLVHTVDLVSAGPMGNGTLNLTLGPNQNGVKYEYTGTYIAKVQNEDYNGNYTGASTSFPVQVHEVGVMSNYQAQQAIGKNWNIVMKKAKKPVTELGMGDQGDGGSTAGRGNGAWWDDGALGPDYQYNPFPNKPTQQPGQTPKDEDKKDDKNEHPDSIDIPTIKNGDTLEIKRYKYEGWADSDSKGRVVKTYEDLHPKDKKVQNK